MKHILLFLIMSIVLPNTNFAQCLISSQSEDANLAGSGYMGNSFTACQSGYISKIRVLNDGDRSNITINIYSGEGVDGSLLGAVNGGTLHSATTYTDWSEINIYPQNISVTSGNVYTFYFPDNGGSNEVAIYYRDFNLVNGGQMYQYDFNSSTMLTDPGYDLLFEIDIVDTPFPVELSSFTSVVSGNQVILNWQTETEVNNYGFEIERGSHTSTSLSMTSWEKIGFVQGYGNSNSQKNYLFTDNPGSEGNFQYRLKQIDINGQYEYSQVAEVSLMKLNEFSLEQNYPNPFNPTTKINYVIPEETFVTIKIYDVLGKEVTTLVNEVKQAGSHKIEFNGEGLSSGLYFYRMESGGFTSTKKLMLMK